jgi:histidinol-phosphatase (PHP family)
MSLPLIYRFEISRCTDVTQPKRQLILERGGRFTLSDDSHGPKDVGLYYNKLQPYLAEMNVQSLYYLALDSNGKVIVREHSNAVQDTFWDNVQNW